MNLKETLSEIKKGTAEKLPKEKLAIMEASTNVLIKESLSAKAIQTGDVLPAFQLPDVNNNSKSLASYTNKFLIISFYRGGWCPYCNMELKALQDILPELKTLGADLVAISPETPDNSLTTSEKNELSFSVLSDIDNKYAKSIGLVFQMPENLRELYHSFNLNVDIHNGNKDYELPMPATYVLNEKREIIHSFTSEDYRDRLEPNTILEVIREY